MPVAVSQMPFPGLASTASSGLFRVSVSGAGGELVITGVSVGVRVFVTVGEGVLVGVLVAVGVGLSVLEGVEVGTGTSDRKLNASTSLPERPQVLPSKYNLGE